MVRMLCCSPEGREVSSPSPHAPCSTAELRLMAATACKVTENQEAEWRRGTKPTKFISALLVCHGQCLQKTHRGLRSVVGITGMYRGTSAQDILQSLVYWKGLECQESQLSYKRHLQ